MTKGEFMRELERRLSRLPESEKRDAMEYYIDYFAEAGITDDMVIPTSMERPEQIAKTILDEYGSEEAKEEQGYYYSVDEKAEHTESPFEKITKDNTNLIIAIVLIVLFSPAILGVLSGIGGTIIGLFAALVGLTIAFTVSGVALIGTAFVASGLAGGLLLAGVGMLLLALGIGSALLLILFCGQFIPWLVRQCTQLFNWIMGKKE